MDFNKYVSQLVKTKHQDNFKILSDLEPLRGSSNKKRSVQLVRFKGPRVPKKVQFTHELIK
jgi:Txe/YoeB family toxin of Txe-Axe toxin-antitoxin module